MKALVILATYNERETIRELIEAILAYDACEVLVVDDNSPDGTGAIADKLVERDERVKVIHREGKLGLGSATITGLRYAIEHSYDYAIVMDADYSHNPAYIPKMLEYAPYYDVVVGSRYVAGGDVKNRTWGKHLISKLAIFSTRMLLDVHVKDCTGSFRCYSVARLKELDLGRIRSRGYFYIEELLYRCERAGFRIKEVPVTYEERVLGASKTSVKEIVRSLGALVKLVILR